MFDNQSRILLHQADWKLQSVTKSKSDEAERSSIVHTEKPHFTTNVEMFSFKNRQPFALFESFQKS